MFMSFFPHTPESHIFKFPINLDAENDPGPNVLPKRRGDWWIKLMRFTRANLINLAMGTTEQLIKGGRRKQPRSRFYHLHYFR